VETLKTTTRERTDPRVPILHAGIVGLTLTTAAIHASLGGPLFTLNAIGYATFALAMLIPGRMAGLRWLVRLGLIGFTTATIVGWVLFGARFGLAYVDKGVEAVLLLALAVDVWLEDGGPAGVAHRSRALAAAGLARIGWRPR
jgi:hypothetical protein